MNAFFARLAVWIAALLVMVVAAVIAISYFAYALYLYLGQYMNPAPAAASTGALVLLLALLVVGLTYLFTRPPRRRYREEGVRESRESAAQMGGDLGRMLAGLVGQHKKSAMIAALAAGFAVGLSPKLREFLLSVLKK